jgi:hypothetical protein
MTRETAPVGASEIEPGVSTERAQALSGASGVCGGVRPEDVGTSLLGSRILSAARTAASLHAQTLREGAAFEGDIQ